MFDLKFVLSKHRNILSILTVVLLVLSYLFLESSIINRLVVIVLATFSISIFIQSKYSDFNFQRVFCLFLLSSSALYLIAFHYSLWLILPFCLIMAGLIWFSMFKIDIIRYSLAIMVFQTLLILLFSTYDFAFYTRATIITLICLLIYQGVIWQINLGKVRPKIIWQRTAVIFWLILFLGGMFAINVYLQNSINKISSI